MFYQLLVWIGRMPCFWHCTITILSLSRSDYDYVYDFMGFDNVVICQMSNIKDQRWESGLRGRTYFDLEYFWKCFWCWWESVISGRILGIVRTSLTVPLGHNNKMRDAGASSSAPFFVNYIFSSIINIKMILK